MTRLIDADALSEALMTRWNTADKNAEKIISSVMADIVTPIVVGTPTIDAVEVVRCENCKYRGIKDFVYGYCKKKVIGIVKPSDFCSYGERKQP